MDAQQTLAGTSEICAAVLGKGDSFVLVPLDTPVPQATIDDAHQRGYFFAGVLAYRDGRVTCSTNEPGSEPLRVMLAASFAFAEHVAATRGPIDPLERLYRVEAAQGDEVQWCEALLLMPDTRE